MIAMIEMVLTMLLVTVMKVTAKYSGILGLSICKAQCARVVFMTLDDDRDAAVLLSIFK